MTYHIYRFTDDNYARSQGCHAGDIVILDEEGNRKSWERVYASYEKAVAEERVEVLNKEDAPDLFADMEDDE